MGYFRHHAVIAELTADTPSYHSALVTLNDFRHRLPEDWRRLVVGPVSSVVNCYEWVIFLPDGSKEGWDDSDLGDKYRAEFLGLFPGSVVVTWGDDPAPSVYVDGEED